MGCADFTNPYLQKDGKFHYDLKNELGTVLKVSPDRKRREIVATGLRFPYALKFNRHGDLFATDQEGETHLHGANPLDELDHIVPGRHYGWPPRHDEYLRAVRDEPPVVGFAPQHQSTCGLAFNDHSEGRKPFGPGAWGDDAFVAGFSRGKVWRVRLAKTPPGYVGRPEVLMASGMMVTDVAVSPSGALYIACHSGQPDWGTGPQGEGRIFRVSYSEPRAPQPVVAWAAGPLEVRVAFDRPLDPSVARKLTGTSIPFGEHVRAGDRFESIKPPYRAVEEQGQASRGALKVAAAKLVDGGRTLVLATDPHPGWATYAPTIPGVRSVAGGSAGEPVDLDYDLSGAEVSWSDDRATGSPTWTGWWPHLDTDVVRSLTVGSVEHERSLELSKKPGLLSIRSRLRLPKGKTTLRLEASGPIRAKCGDKEATSSRNDGGSQSVDIDVDAGSGSVELSLAVTTGEGGKPVVLHASLRTPGDPIARPLPLARLGLPWAPEAMPSPPAPARLPKEMAGGDPRRGEAIFFGEKAKCSSCHRVGGKGGEIGPDLSRLSDRDAASVYRDIADPNATINPDYLPFTVALKDGRVIVGVVRAYDGRSIRVLDNEAKATEVEKSQVEEIRPGGTSIMPADLAKIVGESGMRDLLAFLLSPPEGDKPGRRRGD